MNEGGLNGDESEGRVDDDESVGKDSGVGEAPSGVVVERSRKAEDRRAPQRDHTPTPDGG